MADQQDIQQIKEKIDIVSLISRYVEVKPAGKNFTARCPFHSEKTPSFVISPQMQRYKCFGCQKSGDIFTFLMDYEHVDFVEAIEKLAKEAGVKIEKFNKPVNKIYAILEMINKLSADFFLKNIYLPYGKTALDYVHGRGYDDETIKEYGIGYAYGKDTLLNYLNTKASFTNEQLLQSGLFVEKNGKVTDKFNHRVMFSILNERGKIVAFSGRIMPGNDFGPKYLNSPETPIFHKKSTLYGLYFGKNDIRAQDLCIICEAQTEVITCHKAGLKNIVAPMGTALTDEQLDLISKYTKNIVLAFNSDTAGQAAIERGFIMCSRKEFNSYAATPGKYKDLDDLYQAEPSTLLEVIEKRQDAFSYLVSNKVKNLDITGQANLEDYNKAINYINNLLASATDTKTRDFFLNKAKDITNIAIDKFLIQKQTNNYNNSVESNSSQQKVKIERFSLEEYLLYYILHFNLYGIAKKIKPEWLIDSRVINTLKRIVELKDEGTPDNAIASRIANEYVLQDQNDKHFDLLQRILFENPTNENIDTDKEVSSIVTRLIHDANLRELAEMRKKLSILENNPSADESEIQEISNQIIQLSNIIKKISMASE
jgi:DNA primase